MDREVGAVLDLLHPLHRGPELAGQGLLRQAPLAAKFRDTAPDVSDELVGVVAGQAPRRSQPARRENTYL